MVLKLYGLEKGAGTKRIRVVLEELEVPYEIVTVNIFKDEHKNEDFESRQPFGQIPYIEDNGLWLFESRAICRYIALKYGGIGTLVPDPSDVTKMALFEQAASVELSNFDLGAAGIAHEKWFKEQRGLKPNELIIEHYKNELESKLQGYERLLSKQKYVAGDALTLIDLLHLPYGELLKVQGFDYLESERYPNVARWWKDISSRPSWQKVNV